MKSLAPLLGTLLLAATQAWALPPGTPLPAFEATSLTNQKVTAEQLVGQPTILIVTPSKGAAGDTRQWAEALRKNLNEKSVRVRDVLAIDLPFFMSESDAIGRAKDRIPARYHDQTWLLAEPSLEKALGIPTQSASAFVFVLDAQGRGVTRVQGNPSRERVDEVVSALRQLK